MTSIRLHLPRYADSIIIIAACDLISNIHHIPHGIRFSGNQSFRFFSTTQNLFLLQVRSSCHRIKSPAFWTAVKHNIRTLFFQWFSRIPASARSKFLFNHSGHPFKRFSSSSFSRYFFTFPLPVWGMRSISSRRSGQKRFGTFLECK